MCCTYATTMAHQEGTPCFCISDFNTGADDYNIPQYKATQKCGVRSIKVNTQPGKKFGTVTK